MFIKLTLAKTDGKLIYINPDLIYEMFRDETSHTTFVTSIYGKYRHVEETIDEVMQIIKETCEREEIDMK